MHMMQTKMKKTNKNNSKILHSAADSELIMTYYN